jgi:hypothetical protein
MSLFSPSLRLIRIEKEERMERWVTKELASYAVETRFEDHPREVIDTVSGSWQALTDVT